MWAYKSTLHVLTSRHVIPPKISPPSKISPPPSSTKSYCRGSFTLENKPTPLTTQACCIMKSSVCVLALKKLVNSITRYNYINVSRKSQSVCGCGMAFRRTEIVVTLFWLLVHLTLVLSYEALHILLCLGGCILTYRVGLFSSQNTQK